MLTKHKGKLFKDLERLYETMPYDFFKNPQVIIEQLLENAMADFPVPVHYVVKGIDGEELTEVYDAQHIQRWKKKWFGSSK